MHIVYFTHSLVSCWNHGNAHFLRGVLRALQTQGHTVSACEPEQSWSRQNLVADHGVGAEALFSRQFPTLETHMLSDMDNIEQQVDGADLVIVHEWNEPGLVAAIGKLRRHARFTLLFHDTHHRAVSDPEAIRFFDLSNYDGVLAFGATLARVYQGWGFGDRVFVWHEAADTALFRPPAIAVQRDGIVWVGNWGDGERTAEIEHYLLQPAALAGQKLDIHGVRYPQAALAMLQQHGVQFHGWLANANVPEVFARHRMTVHVPRRFYTQSLPGIPTIRVFEALACGIPLISAPWNDTENLFRPGQDFLVAHDGKQMKQHMCALATDSAFAAAVAKSGLARIRAHHTCDIRARELMDIVARVAPELAVG